MAELLASWVPLLGRALLHFVWQGAVIGLLAAFALAAMRRASPQARYAVATGALFACALAPVLDLAWQLARAPDFAPGRTALVMLPATGFAADGSPAASIGWTAWLEAWLPTIVAMWAAGACVFCLRMALGVAWIERLRRHPQPHGHAHWQQRLDELAARFGLRGRVMLRMVDGIDSPASAGWWRPVVLLPATLVTRLPTDLVEALLAHELAHIRRHDYLVNLLQGVVEALLFYHPVVWWLSRQVRVEREHVADSLAAEALGAPRRLAVALAELSELSALSRSIGIRCAAPRLAQAAHGGHLMSRIERLLRPDRATTGGRIAFPLLGVAAACVAFYAHAHYSSHIEPYGASVKAAPSSASAKAAPASRARHAALPQPAAHVRSVLDLPLVASATAAGALAQANVDVDLDPDPNPVPDFDPNPDIDVDLDLGKDIEKTIEREIERGFEQGRWSVDARHRQREGDDAFAVIRKGRGGMTMSGSTRDAESVESLRGGMPGDFLWFRHGGRAYTVTDPALVARADRAWQDSEAVGRQMEALGREMNAQGEKLKAVGKEMARNMPHPGKTPAMAQSEQRINELARQQGRLAAQQARLGVRAGRTDDDAEEARIEREIAALDRQMEALEEQIDRESDRISAEAERITRDSGVTADFERRMEEAAKPMEALGERMDELGERQDALAARAERETRGLIGEALSRGLARPVDGAVTR